MYGINAVCDAVVTRITALWSPTGSDAVQRHYGVVAGVNPDDAATLMTGRQVWVFPIRRVTGLADRGPDWDARYEVAVVIGERYTDDSGRPTKSWMDTRVTFAEGLYEALQDPTYALATGLSADPEAESEITIYDFDEYMQKRGFWCDFVIKLRAVGP